MCSISARRLPRLARLIYFSTAYVSGTRTGRVLEDELEQAKSWKNYYELTKWDAEVAVRERWRRIPTVIIRPGVVVGDSHTGEINKYDGPYFVIRALVVLEQKGWVRWSRYFWYGGRNTRFCMVPVDFICDATEYLARRPDAAGKAYHVLPNPAVTIGEMGAAMFQAFGVRPPPYSAPPWLGKLSFKLFPGLSRALEFPPEVFAYMNHDVEYDTHNLDAALAGSGIRCTPPRMHSGDGRLRAKASRDTGELRRERHEPARTRDDVVVSAAFAFPNSTCRSTRHCA